MKSHVRDSKGIWRPKATAAPAAGLGGAINMTSHFHRHPDEIFPPTSSFSPENFEQSHEPTSPRQEPAKRKRGRPRKTQQS